VSALPDREGAICDPEAATSDNSKTQGRVSHLLVERVSACSGAACEHAQIDPEPKLRHNEHSPLALPSPSSTRRWSVEVRHENGHSSQIRKTQPASTEVDACGACCASECFRCEADLRTIASRLPIDVRRMNRSAVLDRLYVRSTEVPLCAACVGTMCDTSYECLSWVSAEATL
jgi:hypothetical protein